jgi:hypothetical protein
MIRELRQIGPPELRENLLKADAATMAALEEELFALRRRVADAQRALAIKPTKKAQADVRIGTNKGVGRPVFDMFAGRRAAIRAGRGNYRWQGDHR